MDELQRTLDLLLAAKVRDLAEALRRSEFRKQPRDIDEERWLQDNPTEGYVQRAFEAIQGTAAHVASIRRSSIA